MESHVVESSLASLLVFEVEGLGDVGEACVDPGTRRRQRCVRHLVSSDEAREL